MSIVLRILLVLASIFFFWYIARKLRKAQVQLAETVFWLLLSIGFVVVAIFPNILIGLAEAAGVMSAANFVFLIIIFLLLLRLFMVNIKLSQLDEKVKNLTEEIAIREHDNDKDMAERR